MQNLLCVPVTSFPEIRVLVPGDRTLPKWRDWGAGVLNELRDLKVALFLPKQGMDVTTPGSRMLFRTQ